MIKRHGPVFNFEKITKKALTAIKNPEDRPDAYIYICPKCGQAHGDEVKSCRLCRLSNIESQQFLECAIWYDKAKIMQVVS